MKRNEQSDHDVARSIGGVIFASSRSSRMGMDKALVSLAGKPLLAHVIARLALQVSHLVISANGDLSRFTSLGLSVVPDSFGQYSRPLAGLLAGLEWYAEHRLEIRIVVTVPTDTPFLPLDLVSRLTVAKTFSPRPLIVRSMSGVHPVVGLWPVAMTPDQRDALGQGVRKVSAWTEPRSAIEVAFPQNGYRRQKIHPFFNIEKPEDLAVAEALLTRRAV
jgi:molybdopterin-guanine dinucleotide biosynthesis protein A